MKPKEKLLMPLVDTSKSEQCHEECHEQSLQHLLKQKKSNEDIDVQSEKYHQDYFSAARSGREAKDFQHLRRFLPLLLQQLTSKRCKPTTWSNNFNPGERGYDRHPNKSICATSKLKNTKPQQH